MSSPVDLVKAAERLVRSQVGLGRYSADAACEKQLPRLLDQLRASTNLTQESLTELNEYLEAERGTFTATQRGDISATAEQCFECETARADPCADADGGAYQKHYHLHHWYPDWLWSIIKSQDNINNKLGQVAEFFIAQLGLRDSDESTRRLAVAIVEAASGAPIDPDLSYTRVHDFAELLKTKKLAIPGVATVQNFQKDPKTFMKSTHRRTQTNIPQHRVASTKS